MYADLYNLKTINKKYFKIKLTKKQKDTAKNWIKKLKSKELEKEKENYFIFRDDILRDLLGYPEKKILFEKKFVEFSIEDGHGDTGVCFEAKGTKTKDLFARQGYDKKDQKTPVIQTLSNMERFPSTFGVCTNYKDFILLDLNKKSKCHKFNFLDIEKNENKLKEFIGIFSYENLVVEKSLEQLYKDSVSEERDFTKEFYKLYHETRLMLIKAFQEKENVSMDKAIHFSQLFLNRLIFVFFAEDKGNLDDRLFSNRVLKILEEKECTKDTRLIFDDIAKLFKYLDIGNDHQRIFGFNGGLFKEKISSSVYFYDLKNPEFFNDVKQHSKLSKSITLDELSSKIIKKYDDKINPIISNLLIMDSFDFNTEVNVNILGHIFEQSISDLEELRVEGISKRKKDGVFYTPEYITEYICNHTIIPYLSKKNVTTVEELITEYIDDIEELEKRIKEIKILDPACGSGAFLVKATEILLEIDKEIKNIKPDVNGQSTLEEWSKEQEITEIVGKNIFGVDINEESVEITKLSLFLQMAAPNKKLNNLSQNIQSGNSLVSDKTIDPKAINWKKAFSNVFANGGFDIIIGNPPYLRIQGLHENHEHMTKFLEKNYQSSTGRYDYYVLFLERAATLLKNNGLLGYILPHKFTAAQFGKGIRKFLSKNSIVKTFLNFGQNYVFEEATVYTGIIFLENKKHEFVNYKEFDSTNSLENDLSNLKKSEFIKIPQTELGDSVWIFHSGKTTDILNKITNSGPNIMDIFDMILQGIIAGDDELYYLRLIQDKGNTMILYSDKTKKEVEIEKAIVKPLLLAENVKRNKIPKHPNEYTLYPYFEKEGKQVPIEEKNLKSQFPLAYNYLFEFKTELIALRTKYKTNPKYWHGLHRGRQLKWFNQEKIITPEITYGCNMTIDKNNYLHNTQIYSFLKSKENNTDLRYYLAIINSKIMWFFIKQRGNVLRGGYLRFKTKYFESFHIPIPSTSSEKNIVKHIEDLQKIHKDFDSLHSQFFNRLYTKLGIEKSSKILDHFYDLSFKEFVDILKKDHKINLTINDENEWEDYFELIKTKLLEIKTNTYEIDSKIDQMVYDLYEFTHDEISIIEHEYPKL